METAYSASSSVAFRSMRPIRSTSRKVEACSDGGNGDADLFRYEVLGQFFNALDSSVRLLKLKGSVSTFTNISLKIECLTDRRFTHKHLSQLKFILPEAIEIKKVLTFDEQTSCMKPNLSISLNAEAIQNDGKLNVDNSKINLRKLFLGRLSEFVDAHPEEYEVPEAPLPEPFNHTQDRISKEILRSGASWTAEALRQGPVGLQPAVASHLSGSFQRRFSQKVKSNTSGNTCQMMSQVSLERASLSVLGPHWDEVANDEADSSEPPEDELASQMSSEERMADSAGPVVCAPSNGIVTPRKVIDLLNIDDSPLKISKSESTPTKLASTPARLMAATPALQLPERSFMSPEDDCAGSPHKLVRHPPRTRSLKFDTPVKDRSEEDEARKMESVPSDDDIFDILPQDLLPKIRHREKKAMEDREKKAMDRVRNSGVVLPIRDVRRVAESLCSSSSRDPLASSKARSAHKRIFSDKGPARKPTRSAAGSTKLPQKYKVLEQFFNALDSSVRLLILKGSVSTFTNISPKIECLTDRRFTHKHLSQLKFILPEAIEIKKVLTFDEQTSCMKPNLSISLNVEAIQNDGKVNLDNSKINLRKLFLGRLSEFVDVHPEEYEVPEAPLPEPFNHTQVRISKEIPWSSASCTVEGLREGPVGLQPAVASHLSGSFQRRFSQKVESKTSGNTCQMMSQASLECASLSVPGPHRDEDANDEADSSEPPEDELASRTSSEEHLADSAGPVVCPPSNGVVTPRKVIDLLKIDDSPLKMSKIESTPAKLASTPARLMAATPALQLPKRSFMSPEDYCASSPHKLVRCPTRTRSLKFDTPVEDRSLEDEAGKKE